MNNSQIAKEKIKKFMEEFDMENRNNRLSQCMLAGLGGYLDKLIMDIVKEIENKKEV